MYFMGCCRIRSSAHMLQLYDPNVLAVVDVYSKSLSECCICCYDDYTHMLQEFVVNNSFVFTPTLQHMFYVASVL